MTISNRTVSLLLLFVVALMLAAALAGPLERFGSSLGMGRAGVMAVLLVLASSLVFFLGRRYILPADMASSVPVAFVTLVLLTTAAVAIVYGTAWIATSLGGRVPGPLLPALGFIVLWCVVGALHGKRTSRKVRVP